MRGRVEGAEWTYLQCEFWIASGLPVEASPLRRHFVQSNKHLLLISLKSHLNKNLKRSLRRPDPSGLYGERVSIDMCDPVRQPLRIVSLLPSATELIWTVLQEAYATTDSSSLPKVVGRTLT